MKLQQNAELQRQNASGARGVHSTVDTNHLDYIEHLGMLMKRKSLSHVNA